MSEGKIFREMEADCDLSGKWKESMERRREKKKSREDNEEEKEEEDE